VDASILPANCDRNVGIIRILKNNLRPWYLSTFLVSKYGRAQSLISTTGNVQPALFIYKIEKMLVPDASAAFQDAIQNVCIDASNRRMEAERQYGVAQSLLLTELGLDNYHPSTENIAVCNVKDSFAKTGRLDAEYYQPRYAQMVKTIQDYPGGYMKLGDCAKFTKGVEVGAEAYQETGIPFVRVSNLSPHGLSAEKHIDEALYQTLQHCQPEQHDILLSKDASPGVACYLPDPPQKMVVSGGVLRLKKTTQKFNHETLALILNSIMVKEQINRDAGGSVILHWRPDQIADTLIPVISESLQETLKTRITESRKLRQQSQTLLERAKQAVEIAIEHNEARALDFLESKV